MKMEDGNRRSREESFINNEKILISFIQVTRESYQTARLPSIIIISVYRSTSSTKQRQFPPAVINIYIYIFYENGLYFTATNLLRLIDRRILTNLAFYRNFNKPCCLSSTRRLFTRLARDNLKLACPKRPSLLLI